MFEEVARQILAQKKASLTGEYFERGRSVRFVKCNCKYMIVCALFDPILRSRDKSSTYLAPGVEILAPSEEAQPERKGRSW